MSNYQISLLLIAFIMQNDCVSKLSCDWIEYVYVLPFDRYVPTSAYASQTSGAIWTSSFSQLQHIIHRCSRNGLGGQKGRHRLSRWSTPCLVESRTVGGLDLRAFMLRYSL